MIDTEKFVKSRQAYRMLHQISEVESPYLSEIAGEIDSSYHALKKYLDTAKELNLVEPVRKEGKKQILSINKQGFLELYAELWGDIQNDFLSSESFDLSDKEVQERAKKNYFSLIEEESHITDVLEKYFERYLKENEDSTLEQMLVEDLAFSFLVLTEGSESPEEDRSIMLQEDLEEIGAVFDEKFQKFALSEMHKFLLAEREGMFSMLSALSELSNESK